MVGLRSSGENTQVITEVVEYVDTDCEDNYKRLKRERQCAEIIM